MTAAELTIRDALDLFADHNEAAGKSPKTIRWYGEMLHPFARWLETHGPETHGPEPRGTETRGTETRGTPTVGALTVAAVEAFIVAERRRTTLFQHNRYIPTKTASLSSHSIHGAVRALRAFATWLHEAGYTDANVLAALKPPKTHKAVVDTLTDEEIERLLRAIDRTTAIGVRDYALLVTYLDTGAVQ